MKSNSKKSKIHLKNDDDDEEALLEEALFGKDFLTDYKQNHTVIEIMIDNKPSKRPQQVWHDDDDDAVIVDLDSSNRLKKLKSSKHDSIVTGTAMTEKLRERFQTKQLKWAKTKDEDIVEMNKESGIDKEDLALLYQTGSMVSQPQQQREKMSKYNRINEKKSTKQFPPGHFSMLRLVNANIAEPSKQPITAINFHSTSNLLLAAGQDRHVRFFRIDGEKNPKQLSFRVQDMKIEDAKFLGDDVIVV